MDKTDDTNREVFNSGAVRNKTDYRYDLLPPTVFNTTLSSNYVPLAMTLLQIGRDDAQIRQHRSDNLYTALAEFIADMGEYEDAPNSSIVHLYAQALHEGAKKYGERNWEKGIPIPNLVNHALHHLYKVYANDQTENHLSHLVWNVMTIIHFCYENKTE